MSRWIPVAVIFLGLVALAVGLQIWRDASYGEPGRSGDLLYLRSGEVIEKAALSYDAIVADVYWIRAVQHFGRTRQSTTETKRYDLLHPLLDIATSLDPLFNIAYRFGAIFLAEEYPGGAGRPDLAIALLEKGLRARPDRWQYMQDIGFVHYWSRRDPQAAAEWFERGSAVPGAPWWMKSLAAVTRAVGGDRSGSRILWRQLYEMADNDWVRTEAERRLLQLDALDQLDWLNARVRAFAERHGRPASAWSDLARDGLVGGVPHDPTGAPYVLDPATGEATVSSTSRLYPMPTAGPGR